MASYRDLYNLWQMGGELQARFEVACIIAAGQILNEDQLTPYHAERVAWANQVLKDDSGTMARKMLRRAISNNASLQEMGQAVSDSDIQFIVNSNINLIATNETAG